MSQKRTSYPKRRCGNGPNVRTGVPDLQGLSALGCTPHPESPGLSFPNMGSVAATTHSHAHFTHTHIKSCRIKSRPWFFLGREGGKGSFSLNWNRKLRSHTDHAVITQFGYRGSRQSRRPQCRSSSTPALCTGYKSQNELEMTSSSAKSSILLGTLHEKERKTEKGSIFFTPTHTFS